MDADEADKQIREWNRLAGEVDIMVERAGNDPVYMASLDLNLRQNGATLPAGSLLRACAEKIMPPAFVWEVVTTVGGFAYLVLKSMNESV